MPTTEIYRVKIDPANVDRLLEIRGAAVAEFQQQVPELLQADLVRLDDEVWLDILVWSEPSTPSGSVRPRSAPRRAPRCTA